MYWLIPYVRIAFEVYTWLIVARILISWVPHNPYSPIFRFIYEITEPILAPFRKIFGRMTYPIDFSPIVVLLVLRMVESAIIRLLRII